MSYAHIAKEGMRQLIPTGMSRVKHPMVIAFTCEHALVMFSLTICCKYTDTVGNIAIVVAIGCYVSKYGPKQVPLSRRMLLAACGEDALIAFGDYGLAAAALTFTDTGRQRNLCTSL